MTFEVKYYVDIELERVNDVLAVLRGFTFTITPLENPSGPPPTTAHEIICSKVFHDEDALRALDNGYFIQRIAGVKTILPMYDVPKKTRKPLIPIFISSGITFALIFTAIHSIKSDATWWEIFFYAGIPTIITFFSQALYKFFK